MLVDLSQPFNSNLPRSFLPLAQLAIHFPELFRSPKSCNTSSYDGRHCLWLLKKQFCLSRVKPSWDDSSLPMTSGRRRSKYAVSFEELKPTMKKLHAWGQVAACSRLKGQMRRVHRLIDAARVCCHLWRDRYIRISRRPPQTECTHRALPDALCWLVRQTPSVKHGG